MTARTLVLAAVLTLTTVPAAAGEHLPVGELRKGCGFTEDQWDEGVYDCAGSIPSIQEPGFVNASAGDAWLEDGDVVIGVEAGGTAKAYPIRILNWHEIVNDEVDGEPIAVTYCPLCGSSVVYERTVDERVLDLHVSGYLFRQDLVMVDEQTHSLWPQIEGTAARGPLHGTDLRLFPSTTVAWEDWKAKHPDTLVLERPGCDDGSTGNQRGCSGGSYQRNYDAYPYGGYRNDRSVGISGETRGDVEGIHPKDTVAGVTLDGTSKAYPFSLLSSKRIINDELGGVPIVVTWFSSDAQVFKRPGPGNVTLAEDNATILDSQGRAYDIVTGKAQDGAMDLERIETVDLFWFAWLDHHPDTQVFTGNGTQQVEGHDPARSTPGPGLALAALAVIATAGLVRRWRRRP